MKAHPLKVAREQRGWSQAKIAEALGVTTRTVIRWEQGQAIPFPYYREQICLLFGKSVQELGLVVSIKDTFEEEGPHTYQSQVAQPETEATLTDPTIPTYSHVNGLIGRENTLQSIKQVLLHTEKYAQTALYGLPGIGKTAIAVALTTDREVQNHFRDGILWAGLGPNPNRLGLLTHWGALLGISPKDVENVTSSKAWSRTLHAIIGQRRMLLIIDDAWSIEDAMALQVGGSRCAHLLTTRQPHIGFAFTPDSAQAISELQEADGVALLARFVPQLVQSEPEQAQTLERLVGGLPLALTLMGKYLAAQAFTQQPRRLQTALNQLHSTEKRIHISMPIMPDKSSTDLPDGIPFSLYTTIQVSDQHLPLQAHAALCALATFPPKPNSFSEEAALLVSQQTVEILDILWDAGLLESYGAGRYTLHQTIADYAATLGGLTEARQRLVSTMVEYIQTRQHDYEALGSEVTNILAALDCAVTFEMHTFLIQGIIAFADFMHLRGLYKQAYYYLKKALHVPQGEIHPADRLLVLQRLAHFAMMCGIYEEAQNDGLQGLALALTPKETRIECDRLSSLGQAAYKRGDCLEATTHIEHALRLARQLDDSERICTLLSLRGRTLQLQGNSRQTMFYFQEGFSLTQQKGHQQATIHLLTSLGTATGELGNYDQSDQYCLTDLVLARRLNNQDVQIRLLNSRGSTDWNQGEFSQAAAYYHEGLALARQIGHQEHTTRVLSNLGATSWEQGKHVQAEQYLRESVDIARQLDHCENLLFALTNLGSLLGRQEQYASANICFQESLELAQQLGSSWHISGILNDWGEIHLRHRQLDAAAAVFHEVIKQHNTTDQNSEVIAKALYGLARIALLQSNHTETLSLSQKSIERLEAMGH
ncbi:tetratricopeptide repeat protein [Tengunoibacter tsumagoiensis]|uniref:HTH cro/C1-type domain-containing protein n=1 Tax=Tengunoibacter tsumagoiensis TaxID=2014871 RepID=A0A402A5D2_9CHLR|nr:tetratricopeptide repeat protein [Tengunoibacter tsumagoiensis]GCE14348.1 hypothetical protein KTT_42070 [Tengunoibacter tsumagoiensis]